MGLLSYFGLGAEAEVPEVETSTAEAPMFTETTTELLFTRLDSGVFVNWAQVVTVVPCPNPGQCDSLWAIAHLANGRELVLTKRDCRDLGL
jgi:hypothetical protein